MEKIIKYFFIILISIAFGYFWTYKAYTPQINQLEQEISLLKQELKSLK